MFVLAISAALPGLSHGQAVQRVRFTPPVIPTGYTQPVRLEALIPGNPASVAFEYDRVDRPLSDDGKNGDQKAGDGWWTIELKAEEILAKNTPDRVHRPFIGFLKPGSNARFNVVAECWTPELALPKVRPLANAGQETDYVVNFVATAAQLESYDPKFWAKRFYATHRDSFDFLNIVHVGGKIGNRYHISTRSDATGLSANAFNSGREYGSAGRLLGINTFPLAPLFDGGDKGFIHETGHQWINFLAGTPFAGGVPHWPKGNIAANVMGFSIGGPGQQGGDFGFSFTAESAGGYTVGRGDPLAQTTFNTMELYLMGLIPPGEVGAFFVLKDQTRNIGPGQKLSADEIIPVSVQEVIKVRGARKPDSTTAQKNFRCATILLSEQLLDPQALALYDWLARRCEARAPHAFASGLATGMCNPWFLATGGRSVMTSKLTDDPQPLAPLVPPPRRQIGR